MSRPFTTPDVYRAIADANRREVLSLLASRERTVRELEGELSLSQSALSQHLKVLRDVGLVTARVDGREHYYSLEPAPLREVADWMQQYSRFWHTKLLALGKHLEKKHGPPLVAAEAPIEKKSTKKKSTNPKK